MVIAATVSCRTDVDELFLAQVLPAITRYTRRYCSRWNPAQRDEAVAEATAAGYQYLLRLHQKGRLCDALTHSFIRNTLFHVLSDRHVGGGQSSRCVMSRNTQHRHGVRVTGLNSASESGWDRQLMVDRRATPAELACLRIDFGAWYTQQSLSHQRMIDLLIAGERPGEVARRCRLSPGRISQLRRLWRKSWEHAA